jgi:LPS sulfotransferase NodH
MRTGAAPRPFILLATQRSGSSWVQEMLNSHPDLKVYNELFLADAEGISIWEPRDIEFANTYLKTHMRRSWSLRDYWTIRYVRHVFCQPDALGVGFKYMYDQVRHSRAVLPYTAAARIPVVHLIRRNLLNVVISSTLAGATGLYHRPIDGRPPIPWAPSDPVEERITLDPAEVVRQLTDLARRRDRYRRWLRLTRDPTCEIQYEELASDPSAFGRILSFVGLPARDWSNLSSGLTRLRTAPQSAVVENFEEVRACLSGTAFESFVET